MNYRIEIIATIGAIDVVFTLLCFAVAFFGWWTKSEGVAIPLIIGVFCLLNVIALWLAR